MADKVNDVTTNTASPPISGSQLDCAFDLKTLVEVRAQVKAYAQEAGLFNLRLYKFVIAANEVMTNAVHHGGGTGHVRVWRDGNRLCCEVSDHGSGMASGRSTGYERPEPGTIGGWGLWLTREICEVVAIATTENGTRISLQYPLA